MGRYRKIFLNKHIFSVSDNYNINTLLYIISRFKTGMLDLIQDAIILKDKCVNTEYCYECEYKGLCYNYFKVEPRYLEILKIGQALREIQRRDY